MNAPRRRRQSGFTLMEVLLVLAILVILGSFAVVALSNVMVDASVDQAKAQVGLLAGAVDQYFFNIRQYPPTSMGLESLINPPGDLTNPKKWRGPYLQPAVVPLDPWDRPYMYAAPGKYNPTSYDIWSTGPNGVDGDDDDIGNWPMQQ